MGSRALGWVGLFASVAFWFRVCRSAARISSAASANLGSGTGR